jgi:hypothetical protein
VPVIPVTREAPKKERIMVQAGPGIKQTLTSKVIQAKRAGRAAQLVECLPSEWEAVSLNPVPQKQNRTKETNKKSLFPSSTTVRNTRLKEKNLVFCMLNAL